MTSTGALPFEQLDFVYTPSADVAADLGYFAEVLGGRIEFAIEAMGTRVAAVALADGAPLVLLADHVHGEAPILVYRVTDLERELEAMRSRGWTPAATFEIPHGPCCSFDAPGGQRLALYQLVRPEATERFAGRRDF
jgi:hypothetical protein